MVIQNNGGRGIVTHSRYSAPRNNIIITDSAYTYGGFFCFISAGCEAGGMGNDAKIRLLVLLYDGHQLCWCYHDGGLREVLGVPCDQICIFF